MKKQLLAIAIGAATVAPMAAMAEAELYGRWDVSAQKSESIGATGSQDAGANNSTIPGTSRYTAGSNTGDHQELRNNTSWLGVRGASDLYDAQMSAVYQLEMGFAPGLDSAGIPGFTLRNTYVGLDNNDWGKVFVGRYDSIIKQAEFSVDQFNYTDADMGRLLGASQVRYDDTLNYHSPKFGPSLQVKLQFSPGESRLDIDDAGEVDRETSMIDGMGISLGMQEGNMYGAIAYETAQVKLNPGGPTSDQQIMRVTGGLDGDDFGVGLLYEQHDSSDASDAFPNGDDSRTGWLISGRFNPVERLAVKAQYGTSETNVPGHGANNNNDDGLTSATVGADYALGDQTKVYTFYSMNEADNSNDDSEFNVLSLGMEHRF